MKPCRKVRPWLEWLAAGEISDRKRLWAEAHLRECSSCRKELAGWQALLAAAAQRTSAEMECRSIDWDAVSGRIMRKIDHAGEAPRIPLGRPLFSFALPSVAAVVVSLAVALGIFFWMRPHRQVAPSPGGGLESAATIAQLQTGLAREEVISYLRQSQLMFTDLLKNCADEEVASWEIRLYSRQARKLLMKKKYFQRNLPALEWLRVRNVSERIDWLNYEILQLDDQPLCSQISRLQQIMENEKLLLKIRLLEKDLTLPPYQEV